MRQFAAANTIQILVMNIQAFQKDVEEDADPTKANIINRAQDRMSGRRPIEFIQATRPVVIIDEPQNMESDAAAAAIDRLNPFCTLRYSATHKSPYNRVYRLGPIDAYDLNLVKRIEVASVVADENLNAAFVRSLAVDATKARARSDQPRAGIASSRRRSGSSAATTCRRIWRPPRVRQRIDRRRHLVPAGRRGDRVHKRHRGHSSEAADGFDEDVRRAQVFETVRQHLDKERTLASLGVKVLSLFFIDKVANYRGVRR